MQKSFLFLLLIAGILGIIWLWSGSDQTSAIEDVAGEFLPAEELPIEPPAPVYDVREYTVEAGDTFTIAMEGLDISYSTALAMVEAASSTFDFTRIREGKTFVLTHDGDDLISLAYEPDSERIITVDFTSGGSIDTVREDAIIYDMGIAQADATIESSLFLAGAEAGLPDVLLLELAEVFAWTIDFATQVQTGDSFRVLYETRARDGVPAGTGDILAAEFMNNGHAYYGYRFEDTEGKVQYFDEEGNSLIKQFLRAPLKYNRISSGFSYARFHPTLEKTTPHRAIDYAAALGTPIYSVGDGTVVFAGWNGGYGNFIKIRHNSTYQTHYAHLSAYANGLSVGDVVEQGQVIGYVGSTGFSTGPHLHYEIQKDGELVNPLEVELPAGDPIPEDRRIDFDRVKYEYHTQLMQ